MRRVQGNKAESPKHRERHLPKEPVINHGDKGNLPIWERRAEVRMRVEVRRKEWHRGGGVSWRVTIRQKR